MLILVFLQSMDHFRTILLERATHLFYTFHAIHIALICFCKGTGNQRLLLFTQESCAYHSPSSNHHPLTNYRTVRISSNKKRFASVGANMFKNKQESSVNVKIACGYTC